MPAARSPSRAALPSLFARVDALARNLWWTWSPATQRLFVALDPVLWEATNHNPIKTLHQLPVERREMLMQDEPFAAHLRACERELAAYLSTRTWYERTRPADEGKLRVAYFCAEYGLHECLPLYAGGLGILAGDHLKSASDLGIPLVAVGLLYRHGYYQQELHADGRTRVVYPLYDFAELPLLDTGRAITVPILKRAVRARIWQLQVGRVPLFLLDTDVDENRPADRRITHYLYGGDQQTRIQQELLLGVGGVRALRALGVPANVYHLNEGHAAFCNLERLREAARAGHSRAVAHERVRASSVFTTHTPVPAGHDRFPPALAARYLEPLRADLNLPRAALLGFGREEPADRRESFCMTVLALRTSAHCNGVSALHGAVSREMWQRLYGAARPDDVPIGHITNGIHPQTWLAPEAEPLYRRRLRPRWRAAGPREDCWRRAATIPDAELWALRQALRARLVQFIRQRLAWQIQRRLGPIDELIAAHQTFDADALTIGFARRFATYKRAPLVFRDARRLARIVGAARRPVQFVFAGKAHPRDAAGQAFARQIYRHARAAGLRGRVVLVENYDMHVGRLLTSGCDVWLNNPLRPQEASGTSGMKPPLHGGLNCSILDGWWPECFDGKNGWAIGDGRALANRGAQDRYDAECIYRLLEREIVPRFYRRDRGGIPAAWVRMMKASMRSVGQPFSAHRMVAEYLERYYRPAQPG